MKLNLATTWLLLVAFTVNEVRGQLRCYVCENCPDPFEGTSAQLQACPASESTTTTQMPPGGDTTILTPPPLPTGDGSGQQTTTTLATTTEAPPTPSTPVITPPPVVGRRKRQTAATGYRCFRIEHSNTVRRGCAAYLGNQADTCLSVNGGTNPTGCTLCDWEGCNSATGLRVSLFALLLTVLLSVVLKQ